MSSMKLRAGGTHVGYGPLISGLVLIVAAIVINVYMNGKSRADLDLLPGFLATTYEKSGKLGVTMVLTSLGMMIMLWGWLLQAAADARNTARERAEAAARRYESDPAGVSESRVTLETAKYMNRAPAEQEWWFVEDRRVG